MKGEQPFMLLRARPRPEARPEFDRWFVDVHLHDVARIPGIDEVYHACTGGGARLGVFLFESPGSVQDALGSAEAAYARGTWTRWMPALEEMRLEIFAPLIPMSLYRNLS